MVYVKPVLAMAALAFVAACTDPQVILTGERLDLRADLSADANAVDATLDLPTAITLPAQTVNASWPQRAGGADHHIAHPALGTRLTEVWSAKIGQGEDRRHRITAEPVVADGRVFTVDSRALVTAHSTSGAPLWTADLTPQGENPDSASGAGLAVEGNRLYVSTGFGELVALDATSGAKVWTQGLDASAGGAPSVSEGIVYVVTRANVAWALQTDNGRVVWTMSGVPSSSGVVGGSAPAVSGRLAILPFANGELISALRQGGTPVWNAYVAGQRPGKVYAQFNDISGDPVVVGNRIYAGSPAGRIISVDATSGETIWSAREGAMSPVQVAGGSVFAVSDRAELVRLDQETGAKVWGHELPFFVREAAKKRKAVVGNYGPLLAGGQLWVGSSDGVLRAFSPVTGELTSQLPLSKGAATDPVVAQRTLYIVTSDGTLRAFR